MAPKPTGGTPAAYERGATQRGIDAVLSWRVGRSGSLRLALRTGEGRHDFDAELRLETRSGRSTVVSMQLCGSARGSLFGDEYHLELRFERGDEPIVAGLGLVRRGGGADVLVLTDLPARLGLRGGTYLIDPASSARFRDALTAP